MRAIITYHSIDDSGSPISLDPERFAAHMAAWARRRSTIVPLDRILASEADAVAFTFDDAFANFGAAWRVMRDHGIPVTLFVVSEHVGKTNLWGGVKHPAVPEMPLATWDDLARFAEEGVTLGAHSRTHPHLTALSDVALEDELAGARATIKKHTGREAKIFAYPYGDHDARVVEKTAAHYDIALTTEMRALAPKEDARRLPRFDAHYLRGPADPERFGTSGFDLWLRGRAALRSLRERFSRW